jgi:hypothetical protein
MLYLYISALNLYKSSDIKNKVTKINRSAKWWLGRTIINYMKF